jgi:hypothetical protein
MVAHISPEEAGLLKAMGGAGTINPETGLPEYFSLFPKKGIKLNLGPLGNIKVGAKSSNFIQAAIANALGVPAPIYGAFRGAVTGNVMEGIQAGLTAWGMKGMTDAYGPEFMKSTQAAAPISEASGAVVPEASGQVLSQQVPVGSDFIEQAYGPFPTPGAVDPTTLLPQPIDTAQLGYGDIPYESFGQFPEEFGTQFTYPGSGSGPAIVPSSVNVPASLDARSVVQPVSAANAGAAAKEAAKQGFLRETLPASVQKYTPDFLLEASGPALATGTLLGTSLIAGEQARAAAASQNAAIARDQEERRKKYLEIAAKSLGRTPTYGASGGLAKLAGGGMTYMEAGGTTGPTGEPRDVTGTGDGMSDSVPANIEGVQEARLADGEFVIPADVVADIGNGSSDAGSKKLYDMMDRIRMARHGTTEQPPEIKAERLMPV